MEEVSLDLACIVVTLKVSYYRGGESHSRLRRVTVASSQSFASALPQTTVFLTCMILRGLHTRSQASLGGPIWRRVMMRCSGSISAG
eukprot:6206456-Pleurochrysis_carterae.AAC.3